jgi:deoxycytidine triphosphate deaminase/addiction module HigA family antidote
MLQQERAAATPGAHLRAEIERLGLDQVAVAEAAGVSRQTINNIVNGRQPISRSMAARLGRLTGRSSDYWLRSRFPSGEMASLTHADEPARADAAAQDVVGVRGAAILVNHQIIRAVREGIIRVDPFTERNVQRASIELTLHDFILTTDGNPTDISGGQSFTLPHGHTVSASTREWIEFPVDYVGRVGAMTRLARFGIIMSNGLQVEPGFQGHLQCCLFNAGVTTFELRGGDPIMSLEIMPLSAVPAGDGAVAPPDHHDEFALRFGGHAGASLCDRLIRDQIRAHVKVDGVAPRLVARIPDLDFEIVVTSHEEAYAVSVTSALRTLALLRANRDMQTQLNDSYDTFFNELTESVCLTGEQARGAVGLLGLAFQDADRSMVKLRTGPIAMLQLPAMSAKITLKSLARQLQMNAQDLVLALTCRTSGPLDGGAKAAR